MTIKLERKRADENGDLIAAVYRVTLPADGSWTQSIDSFGFDFLIPMSAGAANGSILVDVEYSAFDAVFAPNEGGYNFLIDSTLNGFIPLFDSAQGDVSNARMRTPEVRFRAGNLASRGKTFFLYLK